MFYEASINSFLDRIIYFISEEIFYLSFYVRYTGNMSYYVYDDDIEGFELCN